MFKCPEQYRVRKGNFASTAALGNNGLFFIPGDTEMLLDDNGIPAMVPFFFVVVASDKAEKEGADPWEHISIAIHSLKPRAPYKHEIEFLKNKFWGEKDDVFQYYPSEKFKDDNPLIVHLWRKPGFEMPIPPAELMGLDKKSMLTIVKSAIIGQA